MIKHYLLMALRIMKRRPAFYLINVLGLSVGIAACLLITHYVKFNQSFDTQSADFKDTYRVLYTRWMEMGDVVAFASCSPPVGPMMQAEFPEVEAYARMFRTEGVFYYEEFLFEEGRVFYAETPIFQLLGIPLIQGDVLSSLNDPGKMAISRSTALKYFGDDDPMGKIIRYNNNELYEVSAVFEDFPANMHFHADIFLSFSTYEQRQPNLNTGWVFSGFYTYVRLQQGTDPEKINEGIIQYIDRNMGEALSANQMGLSYTLQPITDIHLGSRLMHELSVNNDKATIGLLALVSWFILLIAWVNFFNLSNIASLKRLREIGIRKVNGAHRKQLLLQFLTESVLINLLALCMALLWISLVSPVFFSFAGLPLGTQVYYQPWFLYYILVIFITGTLSAGVYTGIGVAGANLVNILKGTISSSKGKGGTRKILVAFQFTIAIVLIAATTAVYKQYQFMMERDLGFQLEKMLVLKAPVVGEADLPLRFNAFRNEVKQIDGIQNAAFSSVIPGKPNMFNRGGFYRQGNQAGESKNIRVTEADNDFFETLSISFLAGEGFTGNAAIDRDRVVINLNAARLMGFENAQEAVGGHIHLGERNLFVSGVVVDFFQLSPKEVVEPQMFWQPVRHQGYFILRYGSQEVRHILSQLEPLYISFFPGNPFDYFFLEDFYNAQFQHDRRFGTVFVLFSLLVILVTILGLIGLSAFTAEHRRKEIGLRKILGSSHSRIFLLLFRDYLTLWFVAGILAVPAVLYFLHQWLDGFAVRMQISMTIFLIPLVMVLAIALLTVWGVSRRIILRNQIENLTSE